MGLACWTFSFTRSPTLTVQGLCHTGLSSSLQLDIYPCLPSLSIMLTPYRSWPVSEIRRMHHLSCDWDTFKLFRSLKIARFRHFGITANTLGKCESWTPFSKCESIVDHCIGANSSPRRCMRIKIPYHSCLSFVMPKAVQEISHCVKLRLKHFWPELSEFAFQISWSCFGRNLSLLVRASESWVLRAWS